MSPPFCDWGEVSRFSPEFRASIETDWGTVLCSDLGDAAAGVRPERGTRSSFHEWLERASRRAMSPATASAFFDLLMWSDIRHVLPVVRVPTLVIHRSDNRWMTPAHGRYLAENIADARYVEVPGGDHVPFLGDSEAIIAEIEEFLTGARPQPTSDRVLATVCSPTSSRRPRGRASWATVGGESFSTVTTSPCVVTSHSFAAEKSTPLVTVSSQRSMVRPGPLSAHAASETTPASSILKYAEASTPVRSSFVATTSKASPFISQHASPRSPSPLPCGSGTVTDLVAGSGLRFSDRGNHELKGVPGTWQLYASQD